MKITKYLFIIIILIIPSLIFAKTDSRWWNKEEIPILNVVDDLQINTYGKIYVVDCNIGDDVNGLGTEFKPWKSIRKVFDFYKGRPAPGDIVRIRAGTYRETVDIRASGNKENPILIGPYGDGEVIIDASYKPKEWIKYKENTFSAHCPFRPTAIVIDEKPLLPEFDIEKLNEGKWYYDDVQNILFIYLLDNDPSKHDIGIVNNDEYQDTVFLNNANHIILYGITVRCAGRHGVSVLGNNNRIEKCNLKFNGKGGVAIWPYGETKSASNEVIKCHIYHNMMRNWPRGRYKRGMWTAGGSTGTPNTKFIGNIVHKNGGEGLLCGGIKGGTLFRDNIVYDNWSVNIYIDGQPDCVVDRNFILCHDPDANDLYNNKDDNPQDGKNFRRLRAEGIMTADEIEPASFRNAKIVNNIIIGCRRGITHYAKAKESGLKDVLIANNTIILPDIEGLGEEFVGINIPYNGGNNKNTQIVNNIIYGMYPKTNLLYYDTGLSLLSKDFHNITFNNNLWYHKTNKKPFKSGFKWKGMYSYNFLGWQKKYKSIDQSSGDMYADPKFVDANKTSSGGLSLRSDSPAIDAGEKVQEVVFDYLGNKRDEKIDIGAVEFIKDE